MIQFLQGNCIDKIKELKDNSIDCVVTSPPYWGLRDYGTAQWQGGDLNCSHSYGRNTRGGLTQFQKNNKGSFGDEAIKSGEHCKLCGAKRIDLQFGLEPTYQEHIQNIVELFRVIKPKLKESATIWLNYGDSYATTVNGTKVKDMKKNLQKNRIKNKGKTNGVYDDRGFIDKPFGTIQGSLKPKDLVMIPNRIAIALQDAGWYIRSEIIWHKPNPMPESVTDRPTSAHEKIWLITKSRKYYYDADAIKEPCTIFEKRDHSVVRNRVLNYKSKRNLNPQAYLEKNIKGNLRGTFRGGGNYVNNNSFNNSNNKNTTDKGIEKKTALFKNKRNVWTVTPKPFKDAHFATFPKDLIEPCIKAGCPENGIVLDPFGGAGTTGIVAKSLNRQSILIELNPEYIKIAKKRAENEFGLFNEILLTS